MNRALFARRDHGVAAATAHHFILGPPRPAIAVGSASALERSLCHAHVQLLVRLKRLRVVLSSLSRYPFSKSAIGESCANARAVASFGALMNGTKATSRLHEKRATNQIGRTLTLRHRSATCLSHEACKRVLLACSLVAKRQHSKAWSFASIISTTWGGASNGACQNFCV
jgi:hypothetical protein